MVSIEEKVRAEMENITTILTEIGRVKDMPQKELVVFVGLSAYIQSAYTGMENILKQLLLYKKIPVPNTPTWHKELLNLAVEHNLVTGETADKMGKYPFFRHFFAHSYGFLLDETKIDHPIKIEEWGCKTSLPI